MLNEAHAPERQRDMPIRVLLARARYRRLWRLGEDGADEQHRWGVVAAGAAD
jgi:hypothetical protein